MRHHSRVNLALRLCFSAIVCLVLALPAQAALIGLTPRVPDLFANTTGAYSYKAGTDLFSIQAIPLQYKISLTGNNFLYIMPASTAPFLDYSVGFYVDSSGAFSKGKEGAADMEIYGKLVDVFNIAPDLDGLEGLLLSAEVTDFGFEQSGGDSKKMTFEFTFEVEGGLLASQFGGRGSPGGSIAFSENSDYTSWEADHTGSPTKTDNFPIPIPAAGWLFASGLIGLAVIRRRTKR